MSTKQKPYIAQDCCGVYSVEEINKTRLQIGLPLLKQKVKPCLRCGCDFLSVGPTNRICTQCNRTIDGLHGFDE